MMRKPLVLVVDDEEDILELVRYNLARQGMEVETAGSGEAGLAAVRARPPDLIVLDVMLPGMDGLQVCRTLKGDSRTAVIPVVMLTARGEEADVVVGLEMGADDYVTKPFSPRVLLARIRAVLRRRQSGGGDSTEVLSKHGLVIDPGRHEVLVEGKQVELTASEFAILHFLASHPGWVYTRNQIIDRVKGDDYPATDRSVDVQIVGIRRKLGPLADLVETVRGVGYRFQE